MVVHVEIVDMPLWNWVLLLLMVKGFAANVTCVVKRATCNMIALRQRARVSRSRQKMPEACTECEAYAFCQALCAG